MIAPYLNSTITDELRKKKKEKESNHWYVLLTHPSVAIYPILSLLSQPLSSLEILVNKLKIN